MNCRNRYDPQNPPIIIIEPWASDRKGYNEFRVNIGDQGQITSVDVINSYQIPYNKIFGPTEIQHNQPPIELSVQYSSDGINYTNMSVTQTIDMTPRYLTFSLGNAEAKYIKLINNNSASVNTSLTFNSLDIIKSTDGHYLNYKIIPFVFNNENQYLICFSKDKIIIFKDETAVFTIDIEENLQFRDINRVKYSQYENIILFTESSNPSRFLRRDGDDWSFEIYRLDNIPYHISPKRIRSL
jgi:hypothetical protein